MHSVALYLAPVLGAEKSKTPYYIAGGALVAWALIVSIGLGLRRPDFPGTAAGQRAVMAISAVLVLATLATAVITAGSPAKSSTAAAATTQAASTAAQTSSTATAPASAPATTPASSTATTQTSSTAAAPATAPSTTPAPAPAAATALTLAANATGQLMYNTKALSAKAGKVTITMSNMSPLEHNVTIAQGSTVLGATPTFIGGSKTLTLSLKAGTYTFYCSVPGHRQAGMEGTLTVS
jgi:plastocyanin